MKKILLSLSVVAVAAAVVISGTIAYFSDTETSTGNKFVAGKFNLLVDSQCSYNGEDCICPEDDECYWEGTEEPCSCAWKEKDLDGELFFDLNDVKPGDFGEDTISLRVDNNDAWLCAQISGVKSYDNGCESPETQVDETCGEPGEGEGELQDNLLMTFWLDDDCDNILDGDESVLIESQPLGDMIWPLADASTGDGPFVGDENYCIGVAWNVPLAVGNEIQTDSATADLRFVAVQARHMEDFVCSDLFTEVCDGLDNNYNGEVDEGWANLGQTCSVGVGACQAEGVYICDASNPAGEAVCSAEAGTGSEEICVNGIDDDCDGIIDIDCECTNASDCDDNNPLTFDICNEQSVCEYPDTAVCGDGLVVGSQGEECDDGNVDSQDGCSAVCAIEQGFSCTGEPSVCVPIVDLCDGIDDDGDGIDGEDETWLGEACDGTDYDLCKEGTFVCQSGQKICNDTTGTTYETCDGLDNDCDGLIDESLPTRNYYLDADHDGYGNPSDFMTLCGPSGSYTVTWVGQSDCNDHNASIYPFATETCNGVDDDCDGSVDETFPQMYTACRECGIWDPRYTCTNGVLTCPQCSSPSF